jgi:hypothetical protein
VAWADPMGKRTEWMSHPCIARRGELILHVLSSEIAKCMELENNLAMHNGPRELFLLLHIPIRPTPIMLRILERQIDVCLP